MKGIVFVFAAILLGGCQSQEEQQRIIENSRERTEREKFNDAYDDAYRASQNLMQQAAQ